MDITQTDIEKMLDQLAEYQAQADLLELEKRRLLDEVKIPAEVLDLQDQANKARQEYDAKLIRVQKIRAQEKAEELAKIQDPEMPAEFLKALEEARLARGKIEVEFSSLADIELEATCEAKAKIDADLQAQTREVYNQVAIRKADIETEFSEKAEGVLDNITKLTADIKNIVVNFGKSVKGLAYQAVFVKGRITWNTDMLDGMILAFPELSKARKEGQPSVTLRKV